MMRFWVPLMGWLSLGCILLALLALVVGHMIVLADNELVFAAYIEPKHNVIYRMDIAHNLIQPVTSETVKVFNSDPIWSPDGSQIAFVSVDASSQTAIYIMDALGKGLHLLQAAPLSDFSPTWSPDGRQIAFIRRYTYSPEVMVTDLQSGTTRRLTNNFGNENNPTWSSDNQYVTIAADASGIRDLYNLDAQTGHMSLLFATSYDVDFPAWSPDGRYLLYIATGRNTGIYLWDSVQSQSILINPLTFTPTNTPDWSPDGRYIVYTAFLSRNNTGILRMDVAACLQSAEACKPQLLTSTPAYYQSPRWRPASP